MITSISEKDTASERARPREGELYRVIKTRGRVFEIYYGYYDDGDRQNPFVEPMEMYPNFVEHPVYTETGIPFATAMQPPCEHFRGEADEDNTCYQCAFYERCEELLGVCTCEARQRKRE